MLKHGDVVKFSNKTLVIVSTSKTYQRKRKTRTTKYTKCVGIDITHPNNMYGGSHYNVPVGAQVLYTMNDNEIDELITKGVCMGGSISLAKSQADITRQSLIM